MKTEHSTHPHKEAPKEEKGKESTLVTKDATPEEKDPRATVTPPGSDVTKAIHEHGDAKEVADVLQALVDTLHGGTDTGLHTALFNRAKAAINVLTGKTKGVHHVPFDPSKRPEDQTPLSQEELKGSTGKAPESGIPIVHTAQGDSPARVS